MILCQVLNHKGPPASCSRRTVGDVQEHLDIAIAMKVWTKHEIAPQFRGVLDKVVSDGHSWHRRQHKDLQRAALTSTAA